MSTMHKAENTVQTMNRCLDGLVQVLTDACKLPGAVDANRLLQLMEQLLGLRAQLADANNTQKIEDWLMGAQASMIPLLTSQFQALGQNIAEVNRAAKCNVNSGHNAGYADSLRGLLRETVGVFNCLLPHASLNQANKLDLTAIDDEIDILTSGLSRQDDHLTMPTASVSM